MSGFSKNKASSTTQQHSLYLALLPFLGTLLPGVGAFAQVIPTDGATQTNVEATGDQFNVTGGVRSHDNSNLFHSFDQFDITAEQTANFVTPAEVQNVIGSVNSNGASSINGALQVTGSDASLYLMNPAGILLGPETPAQLVGRVHCHSGYQHRL